MSHDLWPSALYNLGSAWQLIGMSHTANPSPRQRTTGPTMQLTDIPSPQYKPRWPFILKPVQGKLLLLWLFPVIVATVASEVNSGRRLRSTGIPTFVVPRTRTKLGDRSFAAAGPRLWNSLPGDLHQSETLAIFKRQLKTFLFSD